MSAIAALFDQPAIRAGLTTLAIRGGERLYARDDPASAVYLLRSGLLAVMRPASDRQDRLVGFVRAGEHVGEMAVLAGSRRTATVVALRDCIVDAMPAADFLARLGDTPALPAELARTVVQRGHGDMALQNRSQAILIAGLGGAADVIGLARRLAAACTAAGVRTVMLDAAAVAGDFGRIAKAESQYELVLLAARHDEPGWQEDCRRQVDRIILLGDGTCPPPIDCGLCPGEPMQSNHLVDLVLQRPAGTKPVGGRAWLDATGAARLFHVESDGGGVRRLARIITGTSVGLALSGGGARAFAHVGAVRALREAGVEIDLVCGTSMGAIVAAGVAAGWDDAELDMRMQAAFVQSSPLDDIAFPIIAMTRGRKVEARLLEHFGDKDIADLGLPYFCVSADLSEGRSHCHDRGTLVTALRASISLPGVLPPVVVDGHVLVDGGVLRNLPTEMLRSRHDGTVIGCDVSRSAGLLPDDVMRPMSWFTWFATGAWRRGPPIVSILMRSATIGTRAEIAMAREAADLYIMPDTGMVEIRDWRAYPQAVAAGYAATKAALAGLDAPVPALRRWRAEQALGR